MRQYVPMPSDLAGVANHPQPRENLAVVVWLDCKILRPAG
jgi:hypothetical protein